MKRTIAILLLLSLLAGLAGCGGEDLQLKEFGQQTGPVLDDTKPQQTQTDLPQQTEPTDPIPTETEDTDPTGPTEP